MYFVIGVFLVTLLDQVTKVWVQINMDLMQSIPVIKNFHLTYIHQSQLCLWPVEISQYCICGNWIIVILLIVFYCARKLLRKINWSFP